MPAGVTHRSLGAANAAGLVIAVVVLGRALQDRYGTGTPLAVLLLAIAVLCAAGAIAGRPAHLGGSSGERIVKVLLAAGIAYQLEELITTDPGLYDDRPGARAYA